MTTLDIFDWDNSTLKRRYRSVLSKLRDRPRLRLFLLLSVPVGLIITFVIIPLIQMVALSLYPELPQNFFSPPGFTLENYQQIFGSDLYLGILWRTTVLSIQATIFVVIIGYSLAYSIVRFSRKTTVILLILILPYWANYIVRMYGWVNILQEGGFLDTLLLYGNIINDPIGLLYSSEAVLLGFIYSFLPLAVLPFYASLNNLDSNLIEAAQDLGAGPITTFFTVTVPMTIQGILVGIVLIAIPIYGAFIIPNILGGTDSTMLGNVIVDQFTQSFNWPLGAALGLTLTVAIVSLLGVIYYVTNNILTGDRQ